MSAVAANSSVNTEILTLERVFTQSMGFVIPSYQRPYVWSEEDVVKLFDDIKAAFLADENQYFIGSVLSAIRTDENNGAYELIDGQQRTTTLMLFGLAFSALAIEKPIAKIAVLGDKPRLNFEIRTSVHNLLGSYAGLELMAKPGPEEIRNDPYLTHLDANLTVLKQQIAALETHHDFNLDGFADYLYTRVSWVNNIVSESMDLNSLFSSMNTAGLQLEPVDLLKAKLFRKLISEKALYGAIWQACEHTENYFERNLRQIFSLADWNNIEYQHLKMFDRKLFVKDDEAVPENQRSSGKTILQLMAELTKKPEIQAQEQQSFDELQSEIEDETVYCRSIISFELLLIHALRIFLAKQGWQDLAPRIKGSNLMQCFEVLLEADELAIKDFIELLWQVRYQFDTWVIKWVEHDDQNDPQLRITTISRSLSRGKYYINRTARELGELVQLQAVRNFTGDRSAHYWLTSFLALLIEFPDVEWKDVLITLERIDNQLSLTTETQKEASFKMASNISPELGRWDQQLKYFSEPRGTSFEHYWFQKLEYVLWKAGDKTDDKLKRYRITSKNSVEHVHPQNEEHGRKLESEHLNAFGNLVLLSPGENSSYSNQAVLKKHADFSSKPKYDSLKLKALFEDYIAAGGKWDKEQIQAHSEAMLNKLTAHYQKGITNGQ